MKNYRVESVALQFCCGTKVWLIGSLVEQKDWWRVLKLVQMGLCVLFFHNAWHWNRQPIQFTTKWTARRWQSPTHQNLLLFLFWSSRILRIGCVKFFVFFFPPLVGRYTHLVVRNSTATFCKINNRRARKQSGQNHKTANSLLLNKATILL